MVNIKQHTINSEKIEQCNKAASTPRKKNRCSNITSKQIMNTAPPHKEPFLGITIGKSFIKNRVKNNFIQHCSQYGYNVRRSRGTMRDTYNHR